MTIEKTACYRSPNNSPREPVWFCVEGINGVGKTSLLSQLTQRLTAGEYALVAELTDTHDPVPSKVIAALSGGQSFLRTGHPRTETLALLGLKVREYEQIRALSTPPRIVLEDRGVDTVAIYQAAIWAGVHAPTTQLNELADRIHATAAIWRPPPDRVLLLIDDIDACVDRFAHRQGCPVTSEERDLIECADRLYRARAQQDPRRYRVIDRAGREETAVVEQMLTEVVAAIGGAE
ncbi:MULTISPECIES: hypothetical protein [Nocardia]|uniref:hypothetical protein n=1 Tax=Nocardia TaxID=1817 RepID=UPI002456E6C2|nr:MULTISPECIES: hypothetical protein [Nocardia]